MKIAIEQFLIKENINDDLFYTSLIRELEEIIEEELSKDIEEMNAELIDDCCITIENLQNALNGEEIKKYEAISGVEKIIKQQNRKTRKIYVAAVACAAVAVLCATTSVKLTNNAQGYLKLNSFLKDVFNIYEQTAPSPETTRNQQTETTEKEELTNISEQTTDRVTLTTEPQNTTEIPTPDTTEITPYIYKIAAILPPGFRTEYTDKAQINLSNVYVRVIYSDGTEKVVSIAECDVETGSPDKNGRTKITITYNQMYTSIYVNIKSEEARNPVTLNSIYGTFDDGYNVESMRVFAVYSDGTEEEISKDNYTLIKEYSEDFEAEIVIVEYDGCSFQFLPEN